MTDDTAQVVKQAAEQAAAQVAQQIGESVSQAISKVLQSQTQTTGATLLTGTRNMEDIGGSERLEKDQMADSGLLFANMKRTYDEYQQESLESIKRNRSYVDKILSEASQNDNFKQNVANQALQNAVETANMISKQAVRHGDIAIDREWNINETDFAARSILSDEVFKDAIKEAVVEAVKAVKQ